MGCVSFWLLINLIHDFTVLRRRRPAPLVAFVDRVSPFSPLRGLKVGETVLHLWGGGRVRQKEKEQVKWKWQSANIPASSCVSILHSPPPSAWSSAPATPVPGTRTCRSQPLFHRQPDNLWAGPGRGSSQCALEKTPYAWKSPLSLSFVQHSFMGQHWALWGLGDFPRDSIEGYNPFRHGTNKKVLTCCFHIY